jgi:hypothetical protein
VAAFEPDKFSWGQKMEYQKAAPHTSNKREKHTRRRLAELDITDGFKHRHCFLDRLASHKFVFREAYQFTGTASIFREVLDGNEQQVIPKAGRRVCGADGWVDNCGFLRDSATTEVRPMYDGMGKLLSAGRRSGSLCELLA